MASDGFSLPSAQSSRGVPSRPTSARPGQRPVSAGTSLSSATSVGPQRPVSAGTSLVLQTRQQPPVETTGAEYRRPANEQLHLQAAGYAFQNSMGELFEGFCSRLRLDLARDIAQVL
eukprot:CAMPEP_0179198724 /NCGR_PEP_ID=MMETSP0796-20121207/98853_1 /TAXON_ID=73915 /ORGANISM="Pyrodinium bahamense, Strain pbaha01" /LENGTH=116 /DNA_ID=CAMNT_0020903195 /DNA_START=27 /DNA_END=373 /DNA_ORIENTATION=+